MSKLLRFYNKGNVYFITTVTSYRQSLLNNVYDDMMQVMKEFEVNNKIDFIAWVLLPDHIHLIVDSKENNMSDIMKKLKLKISYIVRKRCNLYRLRVWQSRFWDHIIRNHEDMNRHMDYIHYNPVKHELVKRPFDWKYSSIHEYKENYSGDWGVQEEVRIDGQFGE